MAEKQAAIVPAPSLNEDPRWEAVLRRDRSWDGAFVFAVTSTGIYCRPSCPARRPLRHRVKFFTSANDARENGFRACLRCEPDESYQTGSAEKIVAKVIAQIHSKGDYSLDAIAPTLGLSKSYVQRAFTQLLGVSPLQYATSLKVESFREALANGGTASRAAFDAGFDSLSRAYAAAAQQMGMTPGQYKQGAKGVAVRYRVTTCALGIALVAITAKGVCKVVLGNSDTELLHELHKEYPNAILDEADEQLAKAIDVVVNLAAGKSASHSIPLDLQGTAFQLRVWRALREVSVGRTTSYKELAARAGSPTAVRAVGSACGANPVALLVPCHRAVRSDGSLGGYRWGLERKSRLLDAEKRQADD